MKNILSLTFVLLLLVFSCGKESKLTDPIEDNISTITPPVPSSAEQQASIEEILLGKWSFANSAKKLMNCRVEEVQFFDKRLYSLKIIQGNGENNNTSILYRGKYDLHYTETNDTLSLIKVVLMDNDYTPTGILPEKGTIATLSNIDLGENALELILQLEDGTLKNCGEHQASSLNANKAVNLAPNAPENSNHLRIQQEWRWIGLFDVGEGDRSPASPRQNLCDYLEEGFNQRCRTSNGEIITDCPQIGTVTILYSAYGTVLVSYFNPMGQLIHARQDYWRWKTNTPKHYSALEYRLENESF